MNFIDTAYRKIITTPVCEVCYMGPYILKFEKIDIIQLKRM